MKILRDGFTAYHSISNRIIFRKANGSITSSDKEVIEVLSEHFTKVYNRKVSVDWDFIKKIKRHEIFYEISGVMTLSKLNEALFRLAWHKAPGLNGVSPNAIKALKWKYRFKLLDLILLWLENDDFVYTGWMSAALKVLPKKGDLLDPNNWRGIVLLFQKQ